MKIKILILPLLCATSLSMISCQKNNYPREEGATTITIYTRDFEDYINANFDKIVRRLNENLEDGVQVEVEYFREEAFNDKIEAARRANNSPDIYIAAYNHIYSHIKQRVCVPLNDYVSAEALADISEVVYDSVKYGDDYYAYPYYVEPSTLLFYKKSVLQRAGVTIPSENQTWTWADLYDACAKIRRIQNSNQWPLGLPGTGDVGWASWGQQYNQLNGWVITENWDACRLDADLYPETVAKFKELLTFYSTIYDNNYAPKQALTSKGYNNIIAALCNDRLAMSFGGGYSLGTINSEYASQLDDIGVIPIPTMDGDATKVTATNGGWTFLIDAKSKHKELAGYVIEQLFANKDYETFIDFFQTSGFCRFSPRKSVAAYIESNSKITERERRFYNVTKLVFEHSKMEPLYPWDISSKVGDLLDRCVDGLDPSTYDRQITILNNEINRIISVQNLPGTNPYYHE